MAKDPLKKARRLRKTNETWQGVVGEEPGHYRRYRIAFARFGGTRRLLGKQDF